ncbi:hypothetical protein [Chitinimonas sp. BJYL2]|uniref:hypothetical protein n=1 Tax=Chitinimonas sp. BJYL2 TaxID=2976696 RepID=UPI0022B346E1|nr:hypothetical protein [Chitinimonas sp. BJYL2]
MAALIDTEALKQRREPSAGLRPRKPQAGYGRCVNDWMQEIATRFGVLCATAGRAI